jgi:hypothetical protein
MQAADTRPAANKREGVILFSRIMKIAFGQGCEKPRGCQIEVYQNEGLTPKCASQTKE